MDERAHPRVDAGPDNRACPEDVDAVLFLSGFSCKCHHGCSVKHGIASVHGLPENAGVAYVSKVHHHGDPLQEPSVGPRPDEDPHAHPEVVETDGHCGADAPRGPCDEDGVHLFSGQHPLQERQEFFVEVGGVVEVAQMSGARDDMEFRAGNF